MYLYLFTHESDALAPGTGHRVGAAHALEIPFKFYLVPPHDRPAMMRITRPESIAAARNMSQMWSTFARTGRPAADGQPEWPAYELKKRPTMEINAQCRVLYDPYGEERRLWEEPDV